MELKDYIKIYDNVMPLKTLSQLIRFVNTVDFSEGRVGKNNTVDFNIRNTFVKEMSNLDKNLTVIHWNNFLYNLLKKYIEIYNRPYFESHLPTITAMQILKYKPGGFYKWHTDHFFDKPRTLSCILFLNNDYEGGNLCFKEQGDTKENVIETKPNRLIIWPSNFLYPHTVKPITKGTRYSVVSWAL